MNQCQSYCRLIKRMRNSKTSLLPKEYQQVEYLQSKSTNGVYGSIHINTGVLYFADFEIQCNKTINEPTAFCGIDTRNSLARRGESSPYFYFLSDGNGWVSSVPITTKTTVRWQNNEIYINGQYVTTFSKSNVTGAFNLYGHETFFSNMRIYYFKAWDTNGDLIREMYPCYRKSDNKKGFYDLVTKAFYTGTGQGSFTVGADV